MHPWQVQILSNCFWEPPSSFKTNLFVVLLFTEPSLPQQTWFGQISHNQNGKIFDTVFGRWGEDRPFRWSLASTSAFSWQAKWLMRMRWVDDFCSHLLEADKGWKNCGGISKILMFRLSLDKGVVFPLFPMITRERVYSSWILWWKKRNLLKHLNKES